MRKKVLWCLFVFTVVGCSLAYSDYVSAQKRTRKVTQEVVTAPTEPSAPSAAFTPGNLVVYRAGDGSVALSSAATAAFLDEYTTSGTYVQTIALPTTVAASGNRAMVAAGSATSEGQITRSTDGRYISVVGYNAATGTVTIATTTNNGGGTDVNRVIGRVDSSGNIDSTTALIGTAGTPIYTGGNIRDAVISGASIYSAGSVSPSVGYSTFGGNTAAALLASGSIRVVNVFGGDLYYDTSTTLQKFTGLPTSTATPIQLLGSTAGNAPTTASGFVFLDVGNTGSINTCYLVDGASLKKFSVSGTTLAPIGTATVTGTSSSISGLTATISNTSVTLYISSPAKIETITDSSGAGGTLSGTATALTLTGGPVTIGANAAFRGIAFAPVQSNAVADFNGDGKSDFSVYRISSGANGHQLRWYALFNGAAGGLETSWGLDTDAVTPGDFDGDGKVDLAVWRSATGNSGFYILLSQTGTFKFVRFGLEGDDPYLIADYDGDGLDDVAIYRPGTPAVPQSVFWWMGSAGPTAGHPVPVNWGAGPEDGTGDFSVPGDFTGDGKADFCIYRRRSAGSPFADFWIHPGSGGPDAAAADYVRHFGLFSDTPVPGDYDGDGKTDIAVIRPEGGFLIWYILPSSGGPYTRSQWGLQSGLNFPDYPVQGDYDGDGKTDIAVFRDTTSDCVSEPAPDPQFYILGSQGGIVYKKFGLPCDLPTALDTH